MNIYTLKNIGKTYNQGKASACEALKNVNLEIEEGENIAVIGESGGGKSTLMHIIGGIDFPTEGEILYKGEKLEFKNNRKISEYRNRSVGFVLQDFGLILSETVLYNVYVPLLFSKVPFSSMKKRALEALETVGIKNLAKKKASELSGGQKQRVCIARAIINNPDVILADEPTGALDSGTSAEIMDMLHGLNRQGKTLIVVTHDPKVAAGFDRVIKISDGVVTEE